MRRQEGGVLLARQVRCVWEGEEDPLTVNNIARVQVCPDHSHIPKLIIFQPEAETLVNTGFHTIPVYIQEALSLP